VKRERFDGCAVNHRVGPRAKGFHLSLPGYQQTPLVELPELPAELGVATVFVKDESNRLGLPAFKILGASWAVNCALSHRSGLTTTPAVFVVPSPNVQSPAAH